MSVAARLAIEGLRAGVPNGEAIRRLGGLVEAVETRFEALLDAVFDRPGQGFMIQGEFGTGKSHLLGYLREVALLRGCVVSTVAVSKETPLSIPGVMLTAAMRNAVLRDAVDDPVAHALRQVQRRQGAVQELELWAATPEAKLAPVFSAMLHLLNRNTSGELLRAIEMFLAGGKPPLAAIRRALKDLGARSMFDLAAVPPAELVRQRLRFLPQLFRAAGFAGWVVLIDEVELIGRYGPLQRALAYVELAQWLGVRPELRIPGLTSVAAITGDFQDRVIAARLDEEKLTERLRLRGAPVQAELALQAMQAIGAAIPLRAPDDSALRAHEAAIRACYAEAYGWPAQPAEISARQANRTLRHHIRGWITQWDMLRLTGMRSGIVERQAISDYSEDDRLTETPDGFEPPG